MIAHRRQAIIVESRLTFSEEVKLTGAAIEDVAAIRLLETKF